MNKKHLKFELPTPNYFPKEFIDMLIEKIISHTPISTCVEAVTLKKNLSTPWIKRPAASKIKAVVFDVYGTLLHSSAGDMHRQSRNTHKNFIVEPLTLQIDYSQLQFLVKTHIHTLHEQLRAQPKQASSCIQPEIDVIELWQRISQESSFEHTPLNVQDAALCALYYEFYNNPSTLMPYTPEVLSYLVEKNYLLGIVSNSQFYTPLILHSLLSPYQMLSHLEFCIQTWSYQLREAKPSPRLFEDMLTQCQTLGIAAEEVVYIGNDKKNDVYVPQSLNIKTILFAGDKTSYRPHENDPLVATTIPDAIITDMRDIMQIL